MFLFIGDTPLMCAAMVGKLEVVEILISKGAKVNDKNEYGKF